MADSESIGPCEITSSFFTSLSFGFEAGAALSFAPSIGGGDGGGAPMPSEP